MVTPPEPIIVLETEPVTCRARTSPEPATGPAGCRPRRRTRRCRSPPPRRPCRSLAAGHLHVAGAGDMHVQRARDRGDGHVAGAGDVDLEPALDVADRGVAGTGPRMLGLEPAEPARVSPEPAWLIRMAPSTLPRVQSPQPALPSLTLAERPTEPQTAPPASRSTSRGVWITTCGMSRQATSPTPRTRTRRSRRGRGSRGSDGRRPPSTMVWPPKVRTSSGSRRIGLDDLDLDVGAVLRDHRDAGHGVPHLDRGGAGGAGGGAQRPRRPVNRTVRIWILRP